MGINKVMRHNQLAVSPSLLAVMQETRERR